MFGVERCKRIEGKGRDQERKEVQNSENNTRGWLR